MKSCLLCGWGMILLAGPLAALEETLTLEFSPKQGGAASGLGLDLFGEPLRIEKPEVPDFPAVREAERKEDEAMSPQNMQVLLLTSDARGTLLEFVKRAALVRRDLTRSRLAGSLTEIREKAKLDESGVAGLKTLADTLLEPEMKAWEENFMTRMSARVANVADPVPVIKSWSALQMVNREADAPFTAITTSAAWQDGLKKILTPELLAAMEQEAAAKKAAILKEVEDYLADSAIQVKTVVGNRMDTEIEEILQFAGLDEARSKTLREAGEAAIRDCVQQWRTRTEAQLLGMDEKERMKLQTVQRQQASDPDDPVYQPQNNPVWLAARQTILSDAEKATVENRRTLTRQKRVTAIARVLLTEIDRLVGFNSEQRERFLELGRERLMALPPASLESASGMGSTFFDPGRMLTELQQIPDGQLYAVMDAGQMKRWKAVTRERIMSYRSFTRSTSSDKPKAEPDLDEAGAQRRISDLLVREADKQKQVFAELMEARVAQVTRTTGLSGEASTLLLTAAKGAAERLSRTSINNLEQHVRQQLRGTKPPEIPVRLKALSLPMTPDRTGGIDPVIWTAAVDRLLNPEQRAAWKAETDARDTWRLTSLTGLITTEVAKNVVLSAEKEALLQQQLEATIRKYEQDISSMISPGWYLQSYYSQIPLALLTEKQMAEIFTPKQREAVTTKALGFANQYADMIRQRHQSRTRQ